MIASFEKDMARLAPVAPGEILLEEFLIPMGITKYRLAKEIGVPAQRIGDIVAGKRSISADSDLRLCRFLGLSNGYWLRAQAAYDIEIAAEKLADAIVQIRPWTGLVARRGEDSGRPGQPALRDPRSLTRGAAGATLPDL